MAILTCGTVRTLVLMGVCLGLVHAAVVSGYTTSSVGNSGTTAETHIIKDVDQMHVDASGTVYCITFWDEGGANIQTFDTNGVKGPWYPETGTGSWGRMSGTAVTGDGTYIYQAFSDTNNDNSDISTHVIGVRRYRLSDGQGASFPGGMVYDGSTLRLHTSGDMPLGLAVRNGELYIADPQGSCIRVYDAMGTIQKRTWAVSDPGQLQFDRSGNLWMLQRANRTLVRYSTTGSLLAQSVVLDATKVPTGFGLDPSSDRMLIANDGIDQNILIYTNITTTPVASGTFGVTGGIFSGTGATIGTYGPQRFNRPVGVGVDSSGNIYVAGDRTGSGGGAVIEKYDAAGVRQWHRLGLLFVDNGSIDPRAENDLFTAEEHFTIDYTRPVNQDWTYQATTLDPFRYPEDPRLHISAHSSWVRSIGGRRFLYLTNMYGDMLAIYRFNTNQTGEIAIPCGLIVKEVNTFNGSYPNGHPSGSAWVWIDGNGDGAFSANEFDAYPVDNPYSMGWNVDLHGTVWIGLRENGIRSFPMQGVNANGCPIYTVASSVKMALPVDLNGVKRIEYDSVNDRMYLGGFSNSLPDSNDQWWCLGRQICQYDRWSTGNRTPTFTYVVPWWDPTIGLGTKSLTATDNYLFANQATTGEIVIYNVTNGSEVGRMTPAASVGGNSGWPDIVQSLQVFRRTNGEYILQAEDDGAQRILLYRWNPDPIITNQHPTVTLTAPASGATGTAPASFALSATAADSDGTVSKVAFYAGGTRLGEDSTAPYAWSWTNVAVGSYALTAVATDNTGATTTSATVTVSVTAPANVAPTVTLTAPTSGATGTAPASFALSATAADSDGTVSKVAFYVGSTLLGEDTTAPYACSWTNVAVGSYALTAVSTDNTGATTTSATVTVTVTDSAPATGPVVSGIRGGSGGNCGMGSGLGAMILGLLMMLGLSASRRRPSITARCVTQTE
jgi:hypothetical protein